MYLYIAEDMERKEADENSSVLTVNLKLNLKIKDKWVKLDLNNRVFS